MRGENPCKCVVVSFYRYCSLALWGRSFFFGLFYRLGGGPTSDPGNKESFLLIKKNA